jgi:hypothetical protein
LRYVAPAALAVAIAATTAGAVAQTRDVASDRRIAVQAEYLAGHSGHDASGRFLPVFIESPQGVWLPPIPSYLTALTTTRVGDSSTAARWTAFVFGAADLALIYVLAVRMFGAWPFGLAAAALLACSPAHLAFSTSASGDGIWPLPFLLGWLIAVFTVISRKGDGAQSSAVAVALLAALLYTQPSGALLAMSLGLLTLFAINRTTRWSGRVLLACAVTGAVILLPAVVSFASSRAVYRSTVGDWAVSPLHPFNPVAAIREGVNLPSLAASAAAYWDSLAPGFLFVSPAAPAAVGVFVAPLAILIPLGMWVGVTSREPARRTMSIVLTCGFLAAAIVPGVFKEARAIQRGLSIVPFGVLLAVFAIEDQWVRGGSGRRVGLALLVGLGLLQFVLSVILR